MDIFEHWVILSQSYLINLIVFWGRRRMWRSFSINLLCFTVMLMLTLKIIHGIAEPLTNVKAEIAGKHKKD